MRRLSTAAPRRGCVSDYCHWPAASGPGADFGQEIQRTLVEDLDVGLGEAAGAEGENGEGDEDGALIWFGHASNADVDGETDADERLSELDGLVMVDLLEEEDEDEDRGGPDHRVP